MLGRADVLIELARIAHIQGEYARAKELYQEILAMRSELEGQWHITICLLGLAGVASAGGHFIQAARLIGAAEALHENLDTLLLKIGSAPYDRDIAVTRAQLNEATFVAAWAEGQAMSLEQAIAAALEQGD